MHIRSPRPGVVLTGMLSKRSLSVITSSLAMALLLLAPGAFATVTTSLSSATIPADGVVTISTCATASEVLQEIIVNTPSGVAWGLHPQSDVQLKNSGFLCPTTYNIDFGGFTSSTVATGGWCAISTSPVSPPANPNAPLPAFWKTTCLAGYSQTGEEGTYSVTWIWKNRPRGTEQFNVSKNFQVVPEFGLPVVLLTALGFAVLAKYKVRRTAA